MRAMILAAGQGTRLRPHSLIRPKPLFPLLNQPLLRLTAKRLHHAGFSPIVINVHHLAEQFGPCLDACLDSDSAIIMQYEEIVLGTGGGLRRAIDHFGDDPVLVTNGDIYHTIDLAALYHYHCTHSSPITMILHDFPRFNSVAIDAVGMVRGFGREVGSAFRTLAFTGIHVIDPDILRRITPDQPSCIIDRYRDHLNRGGAIQGYEAKNSFWSDMGTPDDYLQLHQGLLTTTIPAWPELGAASPADPFRVAATAAIGNDVVMDDWVCIGEHARIGAGSTLKRVVVWDGALVEPGTVMSDAIVTADPNAAPPGSGS